MTKTLRMSRELEAKLKAAAKAAGKPQSEIMREGIEAHCVNLLSQNGDERTQRLHAWREAIESAKARAEDDPPAMKKRRAELHARFPDGAARHSEEIFGEIVEEKFARQRARRRILKRNTA
jgi:predicted DNA-binding protein